MYKAEVRHVWEHYADICEEILMFAYDNSTLIKESFNKV